MGERIGRGTNPTMPAEWSPHAAVWTAWPALAEEWGGDLGPVRREIASFAQVVADSGERVRMLVRPELRAQARDEVGPSVDLVPGPYGDVWLRDTGPIFVRCGAELGSVRFRFNGWGKKYVMPGDEEVAAFVQAQVPGRAWDEVLVLEGGSIEVDGEGTLLTTRQCLLEPNRNPSCDVDEIEERISARLGIKRFLWLQDGLHNDHTDGHVDTLARFVAPGEVVCMHPAGLEDPNREVLETIRNDLATMTDAKGRRLRVHAVPSPGEIRGANGELLAASYVNFYIANTRVVVPQYGVRGDAQALAALAPLFPHREIVGSPARALVAGGGAFHCITQQQPAAA